MKQNLTNQEFFIKRTKFTKIQPNMYDKLEDLWVICFETGDDIRRVSSFFKNINYFYNIQEFKYYLNGLLNADIYEKTDEFIKVENHNIHFDFDITNTNTNTNHLLLIEENENYDTMDWCGQVIHDKDSNDTTITRDYGLYIKTINEINTDTYKQIQNAKVELIKIKEKKHPLNKSPKDTYINVYPRNNLEQLKWTIIHPHKCKIK